MAERKEKQGKRNGERNGKRNGKRRGNDEEERGEKLEITSGINQENAEYTGDIGTVNLEMTEAGGRVYGGKTWNISRNHAA